MKNHYQILEVEPDASQDKIREQYLLLIQAWHPDKFPHPAQKSKAEERTKDINGAYEILGNSAKRAEYDRSTRSAKPPQGREYRQRARAQAAPQKADQSPDWKRAKAASSGIKVFINGQEHVLRVEDLVKATVEYLDQATKEDLGPDYFRTHAAVRAAASRCLKHGVEIHVRRLAD